MSDIRDDLAEDSLFLQSLVSSRLIGIINNIQNARDEIERLQQRDGFIAKLDEQIVEKDAEIERLKEKCNTQAMILRRLSPDKFPDTYFIHSGVGEKDQNNMPEKLLVCPAYGVDFSYVYERTGKTTGPEW
jgi:hypothetical protein